ncbi:tetratricopeptide repeat protein [Massilia niabensis]|uniref:Tetratricopeptide repeat protein n=1 Tax=Massilia niabensis TaxID=544910 RepID=A0ABW0L478_9BURK
MSLINKMLQDLDARGNARAGGVPPAVKPVARPAEGVGRLPLRRIAAVTAAALLAVALGVVVWLVIPSKGKTYDPRPVVTVAPAAAPAAPEPAPVTVAEVAPPAAPVAVAEEEAPVPASPAPRAAPAPVEKPASVSRQPAQAPAMRPAPAPASETSWAVASERARAEEARLVKRWRAEEARIAALPAGERAGAEQRLREQQAREAARTQADAAWVAALKRKESAAGAAPEDAPAARAQGRVETTSQSAENSYRRALGYLQDGRVNEAIAGLHETLRAHPHHEAARQTLVGLLIESKRGDEAMVQLQQALALDARQPALAMLLARLQIERGKSGIDTLLRTLPYASGNGDYHAFLAGALQRQARYGEAVEHYQTALRSAPGNAVWWMGLGIALQADKRNAEALGAFRQAKALGSLSGELQAFVDRKLQQLAR